MATLQDIQDAVAAYQQTDLDIASQQVAVNAANDELAAAETDGQAAIDAAVAAKAAALETAQQHFNTAFATINGTVAEQNAALAALIAAVLSYEP
jgi:hypothetical protein